jgi:phosphoribosylaminoimidazole-succinocarboxamide synthase
MFKIGEVLPMPVVEFYLKSEELHDPILMKDSCAFPEACYQRGEEAMKSLMLRVNSLLKRFFELDGFILVDFKLEFGHDENNYLLVGDELNRDSMRIWGVSTRTFIGQVRHLRKSSKLTNFLADLEMV